MRGCTGTQAEKKKKKALKTINYIWKLRLIRKHHKASHLYRQGFGAYGHQCSFHF
jgi:hypothetical protein